MTQQKYIYIKFINNYTLLILKKILYQVLKPLEP